MKLSEINENSIPTPDEVGSRMQQHFAKNKGVKATPVPVKKNSGNHEWHSEQDRAEHSRPINVTASGATMREDSTQVPEHGNNIRTIKNKMEGKVERVENNEVFFRLADGRLMKTPMDNVIVIEKLADEDDEIFEDRVDEISTEVLAKYKTAAGKDASAADKKGDFKKGDKRFSGIIKATNKQFDNDAKKTVKEGPNDGLDDNFTVDDIKRLEGIRDLSTLKAQAKELVKGKEIKRMKPEKISFFYNRIDDLKNPMSVIKLMYDLLLAGEGNKVIGSKNTMNPNSYRARFGEGTMGGINRSAPANDVSYQDILNDVYDKWKGDTVVVNELSSGKMNDYKDAAASEKSFRTRPLRKLAKSVHGVARATDKINTKAGADRHGHQVATYEDRLADILEAWENKDFGSIARNQYKEVQAKKPKIQPVDVDFHGWLIRYRPAQHGQKTEWLILDKKGDLKNKGQSFNDKEAVADAEEWIKTGGGNRQQSTKSVTIDFNVDFAKEFGDTFFATIDKDGDTPMLKVSYKQQPGLKNSHIRTQKEKQTEGMTKLPCISLSAKESNALGLQANGRYELGAKDVIDNDTIMFPLTLTSTVMGKGDMMRLGKPGLTVATSREMDEETITELDKSTLGSYIKKASRDISDRSSGEGFKAGKKDTLHNTADETPKEKKRQSGIDRAADKLSK